MIESKKEKATGESLTEKFVKKVAKIPEADNVAAVFELKQKRQHIIGWFLNSTPMQLLWADHKEQHRSDWC